MPRFYSVEAEGVGVTTAVDVVELTPADDKGLGIYGLFMSQSSDVGDAAEEIIRYRVIRGFTTGGSGGAAPTPRPLDRDGSAAGFASETNNTSAANTGTTVNLHSDCYNIRIGEKLWLPEGSEWTATQADTTILVRLMAAPIDSLTMSLTCYVKEGV